MMSEQFEPLELCDLKLPPIPQRSRLYPLEPIGIGTPLVESLTSYITRLAEAHCLSINSLISTTIASSLKETFVKNSTSRRFKALFDRSRALNGAGSLARDFVQALEKLTFSDQLQFLTLLYFSNILVSKSLLREFRAWCPLCYQEWASKGTVYDPLIWTINFVQICPVHQLNLFQQCPSCHQKLPWLTWHQYLGYCLLCGTWLGLTDKFISIYDRPDLKQMFHWNKWVTQNLGELLALPYRVLPSFTQTQVRQSLVEVVNSATQGNIAAFASLLAIPKNTVWGWYVGKNLPSLEALLKISFLFEISLPNLLNYDCDLPLTLKKAISTKSQIHQTQRKSPRFFDSLQAETFLNQILEQNPESIPPLKAIAEYLGVDRRLLSRHCPDLCKKIVAKRLSYKKAHYLNSITQCCNEVRESTIGLFEQGKYPTEARVSQQIKKPSYLRYPQVREVFNKTRRELGLDS